MIRRAAILLLVCGGLAFFLDREGTQGSFDRCHRTILDRLSGGGAPGPVIMVELRRGDLPFETWPPSPLDHALVLESLVRRHPRAVAVDSLLAWPEVAALDAATLAERIALLPRGVLACTLQRRTSDTPGDPVVALPLPVLPQISGELNRIPEFSAAGQVPIDEVRGSKAMGFTRIEFGAGPVAGESSVTIPLLARRGRDVVPSLVLQALMAWKERAPTDVAVELGHRIVITPDLVVPIDDAGGYTVFSRLSPAIRRAAAGSLLLDPDQDGALLRSQSAETEALAAMKDGLVVLGETGENTPRFAVGPGREWTETELLAQGLTAALSGRHLRELPLRWQWSLWASLVAAGLALLACPRRWIAAFAFAGILLLCLSTVSAFLLGRWWIPPVPPVALWAAASVIALLVAAPAVPREVPAAEPAEPPPATAEPDDASSAALAPEDELPAPELIDEDPPRSATAPDQPDDTAPAVPPSSAGTSTPAPSDPPPGSDSAAGRPGSHGLRQRFGRRSH